MNSSRSIDLLIRTNFSHVELSHRAVSLVYYTLLLLAHAPIASIAERPQQDLGSNAARSCKEIEGPCQWMPQHADRVLVAMRDHTRNLQDGRILPSAV